MLMEQQRPAPTDQLKPSEVKKLLSDLKRLTGPRKDRAVFLSNQGNSISIRLVSSIIEKLRVGIEVSEVLGSGLAMQPVEGITSPQAAIPRPDPQGTRLHPIRELLCTFA